MVLQWRAQSDGFEELSQVARFWVVCRYLCAVFTVIAPFPAEGSVVAYLQFLLCNWRHVHRKRLMGS